MTRSDLFSIKQKRVLITGGTAGIGLGVAAHFVEQGARVVISGRRDSGEDIAERIGAHFVRMDVSQQEDVADSVNRAAQWLGGELDVLILNAGIDLEVGEIDSLDMAAFRRLFDVNVFGVVAGLRAAAPLLSNDASVIITSSPASFLYAPGMSAYTASKAAVNALTKTWAAELASRGVRVNAVLPGLVESEMSGSTGDAEFIQAFTLTDTFRKAEEMGGVYQFLASAASAPVTAGIIEADDGLSGGMSPRVAELVAEATSNPGQSS